jgi:hypothetical protein
MLARLSKGLAHKTGGKTALKFRFDVQVDRLENLPPAVKRCRVVWSRGAKLQMTDMKEAGGGAQGGVAAARRPARRRVRRRRAPRPRRAARAGPARRCADGPARCRPPDPDPRRPLQAWPSLGRR